MLESLIRFLHCEIGAESTESTSALQSVFEGEPLAKRPAVALKVISAFDKSALPPPVQNFEACPSGNGIGGMGQEGVTYIHGLLRAFTRFTSIGIGTNFPCQTSPCGGVRVPMPTPKTASNGWVRCDFLSAKNNSREKKARWKTSFQSTSLRCGEDFLLYPMLSRCFFVAWLRV